MHQNSKNNSTSQLKHVDKEGKIDEEEPAEEMEEEEDDEEEEFTPSAWDATLAPHRSALRSPEKTYKAGVRIQNHLQLFRQFNFHYLEIFNVNIRIFVFILAARMIW